MNIRKQVPCKGCKDRYLGCHDKCIPYKEFKDTKELINHNRNKYFKQTEDILVSIARTKK